MSEKRLKRRYQERDEWNMAVLDPVMHGDLAGVVASTPSGIVAGERAAGNAMVMDEKLPLNGIAAYREQNHSASSLVKSAVVAAMMANQCMAGVRLYSGD